VSRRVHGEVAHFLSERPAGERPGASQDLDRLEDMIHHALEAGLLNVAIDVYWSRLGASPWLTERGELARGERIVRAILQRLPGASIVNVDDWRPRLLNELAMYLDEQARLEDAARCYWRALRWRLRQYRPRDICRLLQNLCDNCLLRGLLPLAEKLAAKASVYATTPEDQLSCLVYLSYVLHLRGRGERSAAAWKEAASPGTGALFAVEVLLSIGESLDALAMARRNYGVVAGTRRATEHKALLQVVRVTASRAIEQGISPRRTAEEALKGTSLQRVIEWSRRHGNRPLLAQALLLRAALHRLTRADGLALADLAEGLEIASRHGLRLLEVDLLLERSMHEGAERVRQARELAQRREIDYGWAAGQASLLLANGEPTFNALRARASVLKERLGEGLPSDHGDARAAVPPTRLDNIIPVQDPRGPLMVPVEQAFHERLSQAIRLGAGLERQLEDAWGHYYTACRRPAPDTCSRAACTGCATTLPSAISPRSLPPRPKKRLPCSRHSSL